MIRAGKLEVAELLLVLVLVRYALLKKNETHSKSRQVRVKMSVDKQITALLSLRGLGMCQVSRLDSIAEGGGC